MRPIIVKAGDCCIAEPIAFELLRAAADNELTLVRRYIASLPTLDTPSQLWDRAADIGRLCRRKGITAGSMDLLIAAIAEAHQVPLLTYDVAFQHISSVCGLKVEVLAVPID